MCIYMISFYNIQIQLLDACFVFLKFTHPTKDIIVIGVLVVRMRHRLVRVLGGLTKTISIQGSKEII